MEEFNRRWQEECDKRQRDDHDEIVRHEGRLNNLEKDYFRVLEDIEENRQILDKLSTDRARLIALCVGGAGVAGAVIKYFWPGHS